MNGLNLAAQVRKDFIREKRKMKPVVAATAYDALTAELLVEADVDIILVGDSVATVLLGYENTGKVTMEEMLHHVRAVVRGARRGFVVGDMPLEAVDKTPAHALKQARRFMEAGCRAIKIEWNPIAEEVTKLCTKEGIPVIGHVGLVPQQVKTPKGYKLQGKSFGSAKDIVVEAKIFENYGAFAVVLECIPWQLALLVSQTLEIPTIGIGAGPECDGQILVFQDIVGFTSRFQPRFLKRYDNLHGNALMAVRQYAEDVKSCRFPTYKNSYSMDPETLKQVRRWIKQWHPV